MPALLNLLRTFLRSGQGFQPSCSISTRAPAPTLTGCFAAYSAMQRPRPGTLHNTPNADGLPLAMSGLRSATFSAGRWTAISALFRLGLQTAQLVILARLLNPADFGLMAIAMAVLAVAWLLSDLGLSSALMSFPQPDHATLSTVYWLNLILACSLGVLLAALAIPASLLLEQPGLKSVLLYMAPLFAISALGQPFRVLAEKDLRFRPLAENEILATGMGFVGAVVVATAHGSVLALVASVLITSVSSSALACWRLSHGRRPGRIFKPSLAKPLLAFGLHRVGDGIWNALRTQVDVLAASLVAGPSMVAYYAIPREQCLKLANAVVNPVITRVGLPVMTRSRDQPEALRAIYLRTLRITAAFNFPAYALLAIFAEDVVALLLGPQWEAAAFYMRLFAFWGLIRSTGNPAGSLLYAVGMAKRAHIWNLALFFGTSTVLVAAAMIGGLPALGWAMVGTQLVVFWLAWRHLVQPACGVRWRDYCGSMSGAGVATALASATAVATLRLVPDNWGPGTGVLVFVLTYLAVSLRINFEWLALAREFLAPIERLRQSK